MTRLPLTSLLLAAAFLLKAGPLQAISNAPTKLARNSIQDLQKQNLYAVMKNDPHDPHPSKDVVWMVRGDREGKLAGFIEELSSIREQLTLRVAEIKNSPDLKDFHFVWYDDEGRPQTLGTGLRGANEFLKRLRREVVYRLDAPSMHPEEDLKLLLQFDRYQEEDLNHQEAIHRKITLDPKQEARLSSEELARIARGWNVPRGKLLQEYGEQVHSDGEGWLKSAGNIRLERWEPLDEKKCIAWGSIRAYQMEESSGPTQ